MTDIGAKVKHCSCEGVDLVKLGQIHTAIAETPSEYEAINEINNCCCNLKKFNEGDI